MIDPIFLTCSILALMGLSALLYALPRSECKECSHCQAFIRDREMKAHDKFHAYYKVPKPDPKCNRCKGGME